MYVYWKLKFKPGTDCINKKPFFNYKIHIHILHYDTLNIPDNTHLKSLSLVYLLCLHVSLILQFEIEQTPVRSLKKRKKENIFVIKVSCNFVLCYLLLHWLKCVFWVNSIDTNKRSWALKKVHAPFFYYYHIFLFSLLIGRFLCHVDCDIICLA